MEKISVFEIFKIGIGPSSSHAMGPWKAAKDFLKVIKKDRGSLNGALKMDVELFGSLAKTGKGHGTDKSIMMGLMGFEIRTFETHQLLDNLNLIANEKKLNLLGEVKIPFDPLVNIRFNFTDIKLEHANTMTFTLIFENGELESATYFSVGGGFVQRKGVASESYEKSGIPYPIQTAKEMLNWCEAEGKTVAEISMENELCWRNQSEVEQELDEIWKVMLTSMYEGCGTKGQLPGGLNVKRRAFQLCESLLGKGKFETLDEWLKLVMAQPNEMDIVTNWVSCFALAVNEVNASYGRIVTAPTNGASGVIPAVLMYNFAFKKKNSTSDIRDFLLIAGELGMLFKKGATISAAAGGCQAEIGVSSAMAAGALANSMGGNIHQVLMAAEIAMEHHLGLSCDPVGGLVQIPCIERNTMGAMKAITAAQLAMNSDPHDAKVSLDDVIKTMWETAQDMMSKYKETAEGGLALQISINQPEC
ncbi:MAG: L-serine ammonia-lyase [Candidatus Marinimicrobia bacterium]|nr:L-serine ammonia-lyase [Candidatus Neomarinimicrobiota bacterium]